MIMMNNPAFTGSEGELKLRLSYINFYPGNNYNLHSVFASCDSYFPGIHGGAGFYFSDDYLGGIVNDVRGGFSYSYFLQAGENLFINAGLTASFYHRGYSFSKAVLPDQIDPFGSLSLLSAETLTASGRTVFDVGAGFLFTSGKLMGGLAVNHLSEPDISFSGLLNETLKRKLSIHLAGNFKLNGQGSLIARPLTIIEIQEKFLSAGTGAVFETDFFAVNLLLFSSSVNSFDMQTGFSIGTGKLSFSYNYRFNLSSENSMVPFTLIHHTGLVFSLNNVNKRKSIKTINFPKL
jgi:type IX secretion system PorP/SprF family membrane protein